MQIHFFFSKWLAIALNRKLNILFQVFFVFVFFRYIQIDHTVQFVSFTNKDMSTNFQELRFQHYNKNPGVQGLAACGCGEKEHLQSAEVQERTEERKFKQLGSYCPTHMYFRVTRATH